MDLNDTLVKSIDDDNNVFFLKVFLLGKDPGNYIDWTDIGSRNYW